MKRKEVLLIGPFPPPEGGVSVHLKRLLLSSADYPALKITLLDLRKRRIFFNDLKSGNILIGLRYFIQADIIHIHISHPAKTVIARMAKMLGKKVFFTLHNRRSKNDPSVNKIISLSDKTICVFEDKRGIFIPAFIPPVDFSPIPEKITAFTNGCVSIVSVSTANRKGQSDIYGFDIILEAIGQIESDLPVALVLVDVNAAFAERYQGYAAKFSSGRNVKLMYHPAPVNFVSLLNHADVFVRATTTDGDSVSVREALNAGVKVIASDCCERPAGCAVFETGNVNKLLLKINEALKSKNIIYPQPDFSKNIFSLYLAD